MAVTHSVAVSLSPPRIHSYDLVLRWLEAQSLARPGWFVDRVAVSGMGASTTESVRDEMVEALRGLDPAVLEQQWMLRGAEGQTSRVVAAGGLEQSTWLVREEAIPWIEVGDELVFVAAGQEWRLPVAARPFLMRLVGCDRFRADAVLGWDPALAWADAAALLEGLRAAGVLQVD